jgi:tellurite resistance protein TerC
LGTPALWIGFLAVTVTLVAIDLFLVKGKGGVVTAKQAGMWVGIYVVLSLGFAAFLYTRGGVPAAGAFLTAYVIEYALSVDNLFVFLVIFSFFKIEGPAQHRLLYWGVLGAFSLRALLIGLGATLVHQFVWLLYLFGAFLLFTAYKLLFQKEDDEFDPEGSAALKFARKVLPVAEQDHGLKFFTTENGKKKVTKLFLVLLVVEASDILFALDSIPAALGVSQDAFLIFTANVCAVMGLRSLFFVVSSLMDKFHYLKTGLGIILAFVGIKLIAETYFADWAHHHEALVIGVSLGFIALVLAASVIASTIWAKKSPELKSELPEKKDAVH